jgi:hypothetical protein
MNVKELIKKLENLPQDLPIRVVNTEENVKAFENEWVYELECSETGESGFEYCGEVRLLTTE